MIVNECLMPYSLENQVTDWQRISQLLYSLSPFYLFIYLLVDYNGFFTKKFYLQFGLAYKFKIKLS